jgi:signal transduction histidine kinase
MKGTDSFFFPKHARYQTRLSELAQRVISTGKVQVIGENPAVRFFSMSSRYLFIAIPLDPESAGAGAISLAVPVKPLVNQLVSNQKAVFLYILINVLILTAVGLVRMARAVIRPIERLARLSETYTEDEGLNFMAIKEGNEFRRLSMSLNHMIERIKADKDKLKTTVLSLKAANRQLQDTQQEMVRTEKLASVGRLAAGLAHEIGNPVGIIQGYLDLIRQTDVPDMEKVDYLNRAEKELGRIDGLIRKLLDFSRPGQQSPENISVHHLLTESVDMLNIQSKKERVDIGLQLNAEKDTVFADPDQLSQVFLNCLLNAVDAVTTASTEQRQIMIISELTDSNKLKRYVRIRIRDNGEGISTANLPKVFDPFFTTKEPGKGTGLGLFVSHTIIENIGGRMRIGKTGETGTEVVIELPLAVIEKG